MNTVEVLQKARSRIEEGWGKGSLHWPVSDSVCIMGALNSSSTGSYWGGNDGTRVAVEALYGQLQHAKPGFGLIAFNDHRTTTKQDVLNLFDKTLADLGGM